MKIILLRTFRSMTQEDLILSLRDVGMNVSRSTISRVEKNLISPKYDLLVAVSSVFGIKVAQLVSEMHINDAVMC